MSIPINFFGRSLNGYKANLHTHTTLSDGKFTPEEVIKLYADAGYDVLAFTDHSRTDPVASFDGKGMTLISGTELHPWGPRGIRWHILAVGVPEDFTFDEKNTTGQDAVDAARAAGAAVFCAHPYWCGLTSAEVETLKGICGIEVYNSSCRKIGRDYNMQNWDELLDAGNKYTALAVDDVHVPVHLFRGFTVIAAEDKSQESLLQALKDGAFYASQGPIFHSITVEDNVLKADFSPVTTAIVMHRRSTGSCFTVPDMEGPGSGSPEMTHLELDLSKLQNTYARIQLCDANGRMAWSNPIFID